MSIRRAALSLLVAVGLLACGIRKDYPPRQQIVSDVSLMGLNSVRPQPILEGLATIPSGRFLGLWDGVAFEYEVYDPEVLRKDLARVERYLQRRGYYEARVVAARVIHSGRHHVRVEIDAREGAPVLTQAIKLSGLELVPIGVAAEALRASPLQTGRLFDEDEFDASRGQILRVLRDHGYAFAKVQSQASVDVARHVADVQFSVTPGVPATFGPITIEGLKDVPEPSVRAALLLQIGAPFSQTELDEARRALVRLGVFSTVSVKANTEPTSDGVVSIQIEVEESKLRTARVGGGGQLNAEQLSNHLTFGWEHRNWLGGLRKFSVDGKPGVVYFPTRFGEEIKAPNRLLFQNQIHVELRQPSFIEGRTTGIVTTAFNVFPLLFPQTGNDEAVVGFAELKASAGVERAFWKQRVGLRPSLNWQLEVPLDYSLLTLGEAVGAEEGLLENLAIGFPELFIYVDLRDDALNTRSGAFFGNTLQLASSVFGSDVSDLRVKPEARFFVPISSRVVFATRFSAGFLFAQNYGETLADQGAFSEEQLAQDTLKLLFRGFFSGGANSNRGYPLRGVGPHGQIPFLAGKTDCNLTENKNDPLCDRPLGGLSIWETSLEVRVALAGPLSLVLFIDASDVDRRRILNLAAPHLSSGAGIRYQTPIGPVRFDVGYRIPGAQDFSQKVEEGTQQRVFGAPLAVHFSLGEAF